MRHQWEPKWCPKAEDTAPQADEAWSRAARNAGLHPVAPAAWQPPSLEQFSHQLRLAKGAAGFDGWDSKELASLCDMCPILVEEVHELLTRTTAGAKHGMSPAELADIMTWRVVGVPKRDPTESRPIAIASILFRAWHRCLLAQLPPAPKGQFADEGVMKGFIDFMTRRGTAGAEIDLSAAFDLVQHEMAERALVERGCPIEIAAWLRLSWSAPRICHVRGDIAAPLLPSRGIPAGCPLSMRVLAVVLAPWHAVVESISPALSTWAYADDRSVKADHPEPEVAADLVGRALRATSENFDGPVGLRENFKKRQCWQGDQRCEHLGLDAAPGCGQGQDVLPRGGWQVVDEVVQRLTAIPGSMEGREKIAAIAIVPRVRWAVPVMQPPEWKIDKLLMKAIVRSGSTLWCVSRFWADSVVRSSFYASAIHAVRGAFLLPQTPSQALLLPLQEHANRLQLRILSWSADGEVWAQPAADADPRIVSVARMAAARSRADATWTDAHPLAFNARSDVGAHVLRSAARVSCLLRRTALAPRRDEEGLLQADVEVISHRKWKAWVSSLATAQRGALRTWRSGALATPTRMCKSTGSSSCPFCAAEHASARHFWQDCGKYVDLRASLAQEFSLDDGWWHHQPACTSKSGWVTLQSASTLEGRVACSIAASRLGMQITMDLGALTDKRYQNYVPD